MRILSFALLAAFSFLSPSISKAGDFPIVKDSEVAKFVGQSLEVQGLVVAVSTSRKGNSFINFGAPYPNQTFTGYIPSGTPLATDPWVQSLRGKVIGISGTVELYKGKPEIRVLDKSQINKH